MKAFSNLAHKVRRLAKGKIKYRMETHKSSDVAKVNMI